MTIVRFDPLRSQGPALPLDAYRRGDQFVLEFDLPGVDPDSVELVVERNILTVSAERSPTRGDETEVLVTERPTGRFTRRLRLGSHLDLEHIEASTDRGVLTVTIPATAALRRRRVEVKQGPARIDAAVEDRTEADGATETDEAASAA